MPDFKSTFLSLSILNSESSTSFELVVTWLYLDKSSSVSITSFPNKPSSAIITFLSVGKLVPASHFFTSFNSAPVKEAICLLDNPLSFLSLKNNDEKFSILHNCIQSKIFYTISLNNGGE